jgi:hypothetical protein
MLCVRRDDCNPKQHMRLFSYLSNKQKSTQW